MSRFVDRTATVEITLANGDTVQVRQKLTGVEQATLGRTLVKLKFDAEAGQMSMEEGDWHLQRIGIVKAFVTGWDFKDETGAPVPYTAEAVDNLDAETVAELSKAIDDLQRHQAEVETKNGSGH